jgi:hypothetical protein
MSNYLLKKGVLTVMQSERAESERLANMGLDYSSVIQWSGRPQRTRKPPPKTYWQEYVATDPWYIRELVADVPAEEWSAAVELEDWVDDEQMGEDGDEDEEDEEQEESDSDYSEEQDESSDGGDTEDEGGDDMEDGATVGSDASGDVETTSAPGASTPKGE